MTRIGPFCEDCGGRPCVCEDCDASDEGEGNYSSSSFAVLVVLGGKHADHVYDLDEAKEGGVRDLVGDRDLKPGGLKPPPGLYKLVHGSRGIVFDRNPAGEMVLVAHDRTDGRYLELRETVRPEDSPGDASRRLFDRLDALDDPE